MDSTSSRLSAVKLALLARRVRVETNGLDALQAEPIAIIGMGCRLPGGADDPEAFWRLLEEGRDCIRDAPPDRWDTSYYSSPGGYLERVDLFDAEFFGIAPREAVRMDPQQRLVLEVGWEALESAGQTRQGLSGSRTGVFTGVSYTDYRYLQFTDWSRIDTYDGLGSAHAAVPNRLSYVLDLQGPSIALDTLCSSSLVSTHAACQSLRNGECDLAVAGGVFVITGPELSISLVKMSALSADARCKPFDARADGFVRSEGCGLVVLKRLSDALADRDPIRALIRGSAVNQCGHTNGISAPSGLAQEAAIRAALARGGLEPADIDYVEAHGVGTPLGDPVEVGALVEVLGEAAGEREQPCRLGSVKGCIGHLETAAGVAGLIGLVLSMEHEKFRPNPQFQQLNPELSRGKMPFAIPTEPEPWPAGNGIRRGAISALGMGGSNAHMVVEEAPRIAAARRAGEEDAAERPILLPISAHNPQALTALVGSYRDLLASEAGGGGEAARRALSDIAYSSAVRRTHHRHRLAVVGATGDEIAERLGAWLDEDGGALELSSQVFLRQPGLALVFSGQGSQWPGMGRQLAASEPVFRRSLERCDALFREHAPWSLVSELMADEAESNLDRTEIAQPAIFALQVALAELWRSWGVEPEAVVGHSVGEVAAAHVAGVLSLEEAVRVVYHRGRLMEAVAGRGAMAAVGLEPAEAEELLADHAGLSVAAVNGPRSTVLSGDPGALDEVMDELARRQVFCRRVKVDYAFHSPQMAACQEQLVELLADLETRPPRLPIYSTVSGRSYADGDFDAAYWARNVRQTVRFAAAIDALGDDGYGYFVEVGGHPVLATAISQQRQPRNEEGLVVHSLRRDREEAATLLDSLGALYSRGYPVAWERLYPAGEFFVRLPRYPWQRSRYWIEPDPRPGAGSTAGTSGAAAHPLLARRRQAMVQELSYETPLGGDATAYLEDHRLYGVAAVPAAAYLEMALAAADEAFGPGAHEIEQARFEKALFLPAGAERTMRFDWLSEDAARASFEISSRPSPEGDATQEAPWTVHAAGTLLRAPGEAAEPGERPALEELRARCSEIVEVEEHYRAAERRGLEYGPVFRGVERIQVREREVLARLALAGESVQRSAAAYKVHPALLDCCIQLLLVSLSQGQEPAMAEESWLPVEAGSLRLYREAATGGWCHGALRSPATPDGATVTGDLTLFDDSGEVILEVRGLVLQRLDQRLAQSVRVESWIHSMTWEDQPLESTAAAAQPFAEGPGSWLLFSDDGDCGPTLARELEGRGERVVEVFPGEELARLGATRWRIRADRRQDFVRLAEEARTAEDPPWRGVVHLWGMRDELPPGASTERLEALSTGWISVLHWVQAAQAVLRMPPGLWLVTRGAQSVRPAEGAAVAQAPLWGLGRTLALEHPELALKMVDLPAAPGPGDGSSLAAEVASESSEDQIALRAQGRFVARLARSAAGDLGSAATAGDGDGRMVGVRADGTYLITGGLGGLGLAVAGWLVEHSARHLVLSGRSGASPAARETLARWTAAGVRIEVARADVSQPREVTAMVAKIESEMPPLAGVVHAAGVLADAALVNLTPQHFRTAMAPKALGAWNLHRATGDLDLDFFVLFSSVASVLGSQGQANYAAANAFLDALAYHRQASGLPALSINWGPWSDVGMAARLEQEERFAHVGFGMIEPELGLEAMGRLLAERSVQAMVVPFQASSWVRNAGANGAPPLVAHLLQGDAGENEAETDGDLRSLLTTVTEGERRTLLVDYLRRELARQLQLDVSKVEERRPLDELGMDSLIAVAMNSRLQNTLGMSLPLIKYFQGHSVSELAAELLEDFGEWSAEVSEDALRTQLPSVGEPREETDWPLSYGQQGMWVEYQLDRETWAYNVPLGLRIHSPLDVAALRECFQKLMDRHAILRTTYREIDGVPGPVVHPALEFPFKVVDAASWSGEKLDRQMLEEARRFFDLERDPVVRAVLFTISPSDNVLFLTMHHIAIDFWSRGILLRELTALYGARTDSAETAPAPAERDYRSFARWQHEMLAGPRGEELEGFWRQRLAGELQRLDLPFDRPRPRVRTLTGAAEFIDLDRELVDRVKALAKEQKTTLFAAFLAAFQVFLHRITGQQDIVVSTPMSGRSQGELALMIGHFINPVPLRSRLAGDLRFRELLAQVQRSMLEAVEHQDYPALLMAQRLVSGREESQTALFDVEFLLNTASFDQHGVALAQPGLRWDLGDLSVETIDLPQQAGQFEFGLELFETGDDIFGMLQYKPDLFDATTIHRLLGYFRVLLASAAEDPSQRLSALPVLTDAERHRLLVEAPASPVRLAGGGAVSGPVYVLDSELQPLPFGCVGKIAVAAVGAAAGAAVGAAGWTVVDRVSAPFGGGGETLYLTAHKGRFRASGELETLGPVAGESATVDLPRPCEAMPAEVAPGDAQTEIENLFGEVMEELELSPTSGP